MEQTNTKKLTRSEKFNIAFAAFVVLGGIFIFMKVFYEGANDMQTIDNEKKAKELKSYLENGGSFICQNSVLKGANSYLVSKSNGWDIYKEQYFKKGDLLLETQYCQDAGSQKK